MTGFADIEQIAHMFVYYIELMPEDLGIRTSRLWILLDSLANHGAPRPERP